MAVTAVIADELTAAGYRLAGAEVIVPPDDGVEDALADARRKASLVLITAGLARRLPKHVIEHALFEGSPPVIVVDDVLGSTVPPDVDREVRRALGVESS